MALNNIYVLATPTRVSQPQILLSATARISYCPLNISSYDLTGTSNPVGPKQDPHLLPPEDRSFPRQVHATKQHLQLRTHLSQKHGPRLDPPSSRPRNSAY